MGKFTVYVPDFSIKYKDKNGKTKVEVIEIKPGSQTTLESARSQQQKASVVVNAAKWKAAHEWCKRKGVFLRVLNETHMFRNAGKKEKKMTKKYIHVNQHKIRANKKHGTNEPVITIKEGRNNTYCPV